MMTSSPSVTRRVLAVAAVGCAAVLAAGCGTVGSTTAPSAPATTAGPATASAAGGPSAAASGQPQSGPPACTTSALSVTVAASDGAAAGSSYYPVQFRNTSGAACNLYGYPGVSFVTGAGGSQIGIPAKENPVHPRQFIDLAPGQVAHAELQIIVAENFPPGDCSVVTAHWLRVYPPNQTVPLYASFTAQTCSKPESVLTVETVQAGATGP
jgi:Protein of unknown function (DUF4232)